MTNQKILDFIMDYESSDDMTEEKILEGFQLMLEEGLLFKMQGFWSRKGKELLDSGKIVIPDGLEVFDCYGNEVRSNLRSIKDAWE